MAGVPRARVMLVRADLPYGTSVGSGTLIGPRLVLTAAHVVFDDDGAPVGSVRVGPPETDLFDATVVWPQRYLLAQDPKAMNDVALVQITDQRWAPPLLGPVRWGRPAGRTSVDCEATGFPRALLDHGTRESDQIGAKISPGTGRVNGRYDLHVTTSIPAVVAAAPSVDDEAPPKQPPSPWAGASGAGVFAYGFLIGVLVVDQPAFQDRLTAVPIHRLAGDPGFAAQLGNASVCTVDAEHIEPVELARVLERSGYSSLPAADPIRYSSLLMPEYGVVPFVGRDKELQGLLDWCDSESAFSARLLLGVGGEGKTRLARHLAHRLHSSEADWGHMWETGLLRRNATKEEIARLCSVEGPLLVIVDRADERASQLDELNALIPEIKLSGRLRLLLIARSNGEWWERCNRHQAELYEATQVVALDSLDNDLKSRLSMFELSLTHFSKALGQQQSRSVNGIMASLDRDLLLPDRFANRLTLQMTALLSLLGKEVSAEGLTEVLGSDLLAHEEAYWERCASNQLKVGLYIQSLRFAVATASMAGAVDHAEAVATLGRAPGLKDIPRHDLAALAVLIRDLYPSSSPGDYWGMLQPDRLIEQLLANLWITDEDWVAQVIEGASERQKESTLNLVSRAVQRHPALAKLRSDLLTSLRHDLEPLVNKLLRAKTPEKALMALDSENMWTDFVRLPVELR